jgi:ATP-dependent Clp protease ATP-binding subunit ClpA
MRMDKLTNPLQNALADAQSIALGLDHNQIDSAHLLQALLNQQGGSCAPSAAACRRQPRCPAAGLRGASSTSCPSCAR